MFKNFKFFFNFTLSLFHNEYVTEHLGISDNEVCCLHLEVNFTLIKPDRNISNVCNIKLNFPTN